MEMRSVTVERAMKSGAVKVNQTRGKMETIRNLSDQSPVLALGAAERCRKELDAAKSGIEKTMWNLGDGVCPEVWGVFEELVESSGENYTTVKSSVDRIGARVDNEIGMLEEFSDFIGAEIKEIDGFMTNVKRRLESMFNENSLILKLKKRKDPEGVIRKLTAKIGVIALLGGVIVLPYSLGVGFEIVTKAVLLIVAPSVVVAGLNFIQKKKLPKAKAEARMTFLREEVAEWNPQKYPEDVLDFNPDRYYDNEREAFVVKYGEGLYSFDELKHPNEYQRKPASV